MKMLNIELHKLYFRYLIITTDLLLHLRALKARGTETVRTAQLRTARETV